MGLFHHIENEIDPTKGHLSFPLVHRQRKNYSKW
uniref:Uncharacterized protein n=1 Tax=Arundo donax TaxID=35708 RepID=A0A0A9SU80_ARUDO